ncbi:hypothetical protein EUV02_06565 [Polymorphobacter arshaanensis]|uniref:Uncharacterized protein n=1 Tax=Glacieibacterium arshaanense TaxID=2511025 RepID=A0A4Y9ELK1_9SPHN|nr:hypothetical protein [Polymorphobacter arshaanensis]TFU02872.1 hypothetical protein EUV02_06565 [Polymorphobacter arshaanensis]
MRIECPLFVQAPRRSGVSSRATLGYVTAPVSSKVHADLTILDTIRPSVAKMSAPATHWPGGALAPGRRIAKGKFLYFNRFVQQFHRHRVNATRDVSGYNNQIAQGCDIGTGLRSAAASPTSAPQ